METKISVSDEKHLTRAIEKAATIATVNDSLDRDELLANQLKAEGVDCRFAKVASAAFNKRITVLTFQKTADEKRAEPFALTDDAKVYELMGGETQTKSASLSQPKFSIGVWTASEGMKKTASAYTGKPCYEATVDCDTFKQHIESIIEKHAAEFSKIAGMYESLQSKVKEDAEEVAAYFQKDACSSFEFTTAVNVYGEAFENVMKDYLPAGVSFAKTAFAVKPGTYIFKKIDTLIKEAQAVSDIEDFIKYYGRGLAEFSKTAGDIGNLMAKAAFNGLTKDAGIGSTGMILGRAALMNMLNAKDNAHDFLDSTGKAVSTGLANASNMYNAGNVIGMAPNDVLDADFLIKDRFRDRLMGWSDMSADPQFAMYPAEQVFTATQKAMDTDTSLERPDRREVLRTAVGQLLAQNNRYSSADVAALSTTLKNLTGTGGNPANMAAAGVSGEKITTTEKPEMKNILDALPEYKRTDIKGMMEDQRRDVEEAARKAAERRAEAKAQAEKAELKALADEEAQKAEREKAEYEKKQKAKEKKRDKERAEDIETRRNERAADAQERAQAASDYRAFQERERQKDRDAAEAAAARADASYRHAIDTQADLVSRGLGSFTVPTPPSTPSFDTTPPDSTPAPGDTPKERHDFDRNIPKPPQHVNAWTNKDQALDWARRLGFAERSNDESYMDTDYNQGAYDRALALGATREEIQDAYNRGVNDADRKASKKGK